MSLNLHSVSLDTPVQLEPNQLEILMSRSEIDELETAIKNLPASGKLVEWGSGGSTACWLSLLQPSQKLISIEHNWDWYEKMDGFIHSFMADKKCDFQYLYQPCLYPDYDHVYASVYEEHPYGLDQYIFPRAVDVTDADIYFIDGVARAAIASVMLLTSSNFNAVYYIHDYVGREHWYDWLVSRLPHRTVIDTMLKFSKNKDIL